ncbi:MAG: SDR family NAD(P)-dependent oxidoreductase [Cyanobacteria bacterium P01_F01_bin.116]
MVPSTVFQSTAITSAPPLLTLPDGPYQLMPPPSGLIDRLVLSPTSRQHPAPGEVEIEVRATGLNFLDVLAALASMPTHVDGVEQTHLQALDGLGGECSGIVVAVGDGVSQFAVGDAVIALAMGSFSRYVIASCHHVVAKPPSLNWEAAASIAINFLTAHTALHDIAHIQAGDRILIHAAAGGTGMAAVQIAQQAGAEIFATASPAKWEILQQMGVKHIMNSHTTDFSDGILTLTQGQGVDIVLNSLTSDTFVEKSLAVVRNHGCFIEIAKWGVWETAQVQAHRPDIHYSLFDLGHRLMTAPQQIQSGLKIVIDQISQSSLQPHPLTVFPLKETIHAFRYMQQAKHIGKIVVVADDVSPTPNTHSVTGSLDQAAQNLSWDSATSQLQMSQDGTYLITGGLGGLGLLVAEWLVTQGAKHLVLLSRRGPDSKRQARVDALIAQGVEVTIAKADVTQRDEVAAIITNIRQSQHPLHGIFHTAGVLKDGVLTQQTWQKFTQVLGPKVDGAWHLHQLTQSDPLDYFVLFSSAVALLGSPGQSNHAAANAVLDGLAYYRCSLQLPAQSVNWGVVAQIGVAAERGAANHAQTLGIGVLTPNQVLQALEWALNTPQLCHIGVMSINWENLLPQLNQGKPMAFLSYIQQQIVAQNHRSLDNLNLGSQASSGLSSDFHKQWTSTASH